MNLWLHLIKTIESIFVKNKPMRYDKMKNLIPFIFILSLVSLFTACDSDDCCVPEQSSEVSEMTISINHVIGESELTFNSEYILPSNETVTFRRLSYLLSNMYLVKSDDSKVMIEDTYAFINAANGNNTVTLSGVPKGDYKAIGLNIGLDSNINHGNPNVYSSDHPLAPINNSLHWSWQGGYIFTAIEGKTMADNESFIFHLAGAPNRLDLELPFTFTKGEAALTANLKYDLNEVFINPEMYSISADGASTHSISDPITAKLIGNMVDVLSVISVNE